MTVMDTTAPERSIMQRMAALDHANEVRVYRAGLKKDIKSGKRNARAVLSDREPMLDTMKVLDVLMAIPKWGRTKALRTLGAVRASPSKTVGGLSERQRRELVAELELRERCQAGRTFGAAKL